MRNIEEKPIFITGVYRSGTTILSRMLNAHPDLNIAYDSVNYFRWYIKKGVPSSAYNFIVNDVTKRLVARYQIKIDGSKIIRNLIKLEQTPCHADIYTEIMNAYFEDSSKRWGDKTLMEWSNIPVFTSMYPKGQVIHIIRDPRDVLASYKHMTIESGNKYIDSIFASMHSMNAAIKFEAILPSEQYYVLIYENLIDNPSEELKKLCGFLNINYTNEMLDERKYLDLQGKLFTIDTHTSFPDAKNKKPTGRWKETLSDFEVTLIESLLNDQMNKFNYDINVVSNHIKSLVELLRYEDLIYSRFLNYIATGDGVEAYPSDPTDPKNWGGDTSITGQGAAAAYGRK